MNIKEHIDQEHYPRRDEAGRPCIKTVDGRTAVICATDGPDGAELVGWYSGDAGCGGVIAAWDIGGFLCGANVEDTSRSLLPPPPPKVKVEAWAITMKDGTILRLREGAPSGVAAGLERLVKLTGEIEGEWA